MDLNYNQSSRWQAIAQLPEEIFEEYLAEKIKADVFSWGRITPQDRRQESWLRDQFYKAAKEQIINKNATLLQPPQLTHLLFSPSQNLPLKGKSAEQVSIEPKELGQKEFQK